MIILYDVPISLWPKTGILIQGTLTLYLLIYLSIMYFKNKGDQMTIISTN